jgi:hypothetical protein
MVDNLVQKSKRKGVKTVLAESVVHGAKVGAVDEAGEVLLEIGKEFLGPELAPAFLSTERGKALVKFGVATLLVAANEKYLDVDGLEEACGLQIEAASRDVLQPVLHNVRPKVENLVKLAKTLQAD